MNRDGTILHVDGLCTAFRQGRVSVRAVNDVSFSIYPGEMLALVGESGSGKSVTALSLMGLLPEATSIIEGGKAFFNDKNILEPHVVDAVRGKEIAMIFQEPMTALNPVLTIGWQLTEGLKQHEHLSSAQCHDKAVALLKRVGIPEPEERLKDYPHNLSGGMRQRVMIAIALACNPVLLIADEPTTALDVTVQAQIMELLADLRREYRMAVLLITHNLALVREQADRVAVMYAGEIVEEADGKELFASPKHPYTRLLLNAIPTVSARGRMLSAIAGQVPAPSEVLPGCRFAPRCPYADEACVVGRPNKNELTKKHFVRCVHHQVNSAGIPEETKETESSHEGKLLLDVRGLKVWFPVKSGFFARTRGYVHAVDGVDLQLSAGKTLALVGESGCGKTTVGKALIRLVKPTEGSVVIDGVNLAALSEKQMKPYRKKIQMIFQDPFGSLDPRLMVGESIAEGMDVHGIGEVEKQARLKELLDKVGLPQSSLTRYPHQFSGGQRQRIGLARALAVQPEIIVCDECTSALDVSVQAQILNLLKLLQGMMKLSYLFITHDLSVVSYIADRVAVMYLGRIVEEGSVQDILMHPVHPYSRALIASAPRMDEEKAEERPRLAGELPSPIAPPSGCAFHPRCPFATAECSRTMPTLQGVGPGHRCACLNTANKSAHP
ncbi:MAG: ABC transporter ATP-binding protein [Victivallales bacterium]|nr:ABC transporter ATP-binding protein [Victivallales bacterium]